MRIGELARQAGVTTRTIRHYEQLGLLRPTERAASGYRYYTEREFARLHKIGQLKELGLSLEEIGSVIDLYFDDPTGARGKLTRVRHGYSAGRAGTKRACHHIGSAVPSTWSAGRPA